MNFFSKLWHNMPLKNKLITFFLPMIILLLLLMIYTGNISYSYSDNFKITLQSHYNINNFLSELYRHNTMLERFLESESATVAKIQDSQQKLEFLLGTINKENYSSQEAKFQLRAINNSFEYYIKKTEETINLYWEGLPFFQSHYQTQKVKIYIEQYVNLLQKALFNDSTQNHEFFNHRYERVHAATFTFITIITLILIHIVIVFSNRFTAPIRRLAELSTRIASGELNVPLVPSPIRYGDEISVLADAFNRMSRSIKQMVDNLKEQAELEVKLHEEEMAKESAQVALKQSQLISLQSQIKPHFLFNTLNTIQLQADLEDAPQTQSLINSLATLFRFNLLSHQQTVTVEQEVNAVREYVKLQQKRFGKRIRFIEMIDADIKNIAIPPFVLLTFVENAICHGIEPLIDGGTVFLNIKTGKNYNVFRIFDTGDGMSQEDKQKILMTPEEYDNPNFDGSVHGVGMKNIMYRLHLLYCGKEKISLYSKKGRGTLISIRVPK